MKARPVNLNLLSIRQPVTAIASIAHRISGVLLFLSIPFVIWMLERSLSSPAGFEQITSLFEQGLMKLFAILIAWSAAHHFFAGIRFLLLDLEIGVELGPARISAMAVNVFGVIGALIAMVILL